MKIRPCELCGADAAVFCPSDAAFLCRGCDAKVHGANFLVARHVRRPVCSTCRSFTGNLISGAGIHPSPRTCPSCPPPDSAEDGDLDSLSSSNSSVCISRTTSPAKKYSGGGNRESRRSYSSKSSSRHMLDYFKVEGIFVDWCGKLGIGADLAVRTARIALSRACSDSWTVLPFRVSLAASLWLGLRLSCERRLLTWQVLKRLEEVSGVPARVILAAESRLERAVRGARRRQHRRRLELEEGWAEC